MGFHDSTEMQQPVSVSNRPIYLGRLEDYLTSWEHATNDINTCSQRMSTGVRCYGNDHRL